MSNTILKKFQDVQQELRSQFYEREGTIEAISLALLTKQHAHIHGAVGASKSLLVRAFANRITGARYFEAALSKTRPPEAILGPYDIKELRETGRLIRNDEGYLTDAEIVFLDEAFKMSPTLGHDLLSALNERVKHEVSGGRAAHPIPLRTAITASNEIPQEGDEAALWDRILFRTQVEYIAEPMNFFALIDKVDTPGEEVTATISLAELEEAYEQVRSVATNIDLLDSVASLRASLREDGIVVSDRRWRASMGGIRASAWLSGRDTANAEDLYALRYTLWETPEQARKIDRAVSAVALPDSATLADLEDRFEEANREAQSIKGRQVNEAFNIVISYNQTISKIQEELKALDESTPSSRLKMEISNFRDHIRIARRATLEANPEVRDLLANAGAGDDD